MIERAPFTEPAPTPGTPDWPEAFADWWCRKCAWYGMDPLEGLAHVLGIEPEEEPDHEHH